MSTIYAGLTIGKLTVIGKEARHPRHGPQWRVQCSCGASVVMLESNIKRAPKKWEKSCGCAGASHASAVTRGVLPVGGVSKSRAYRTWRGMLGRCYNESEPGYQAYGGRGITVCERWLTFANFHADMGDPPAGLSLDRVDNDAGYSPENCRWADRKVQARNRRSSLNVTIAGETKTMAEWLEDRGIKSADGTQWYSRLYAGRDPQEALNTPMRELVPYETRQITINGVTKGLQEWATENGISRDAAYYRIRRGWDPVRAVTERPDHARYLTVNGVTKMLTEWAADAGIRPLTLYSRIRRGWDPVRAVTEPAAKATGLPTDPSHHWNT